jgi:peptidoglycan/xylan/chitin deacetylase (PgdA/CDA1 family)
MARNGTPPVTPSNTDLHLFIIWSRGRGKEAEILEDLGREFDVIEVVEVAWTEADFSRNLTRFYGEALPSGSEKERHCGSGPFLVIVVRDSAPEYRLRSLKPGQAQVVDLRTLAAKELYRSWTGGGHRVHATLAPREFAHDLFLLLGRLPSHYADANAWNGEIASFTGGLVGAGGWRDVEQLLTGLEVTVGRVVLTEPAGSADGRVSVAVDDPWWAAVVADGQPGVDDPWAAEQVVQVNGRSVRLELEQLPSPPTEPNSSSRSWTLRLRARAIDLVSRLSSRRTGLALVYHGLAQSPGDRGREILPPHGLAEFVQQVRILKRRYRIVPASELLHATRGRRRGARLPVALTFDDDLASHVQIAAPVLRELGVQATFFLSGTAKRSWWDDLQWAIDRQRLMSSDLPDVEANDVAGALQRKEGSARRVAATIEQAAPNRLREIASRLRELSADRFDLGLQQADVRALGESFEIGFHTLEHPLLTQLDQEALAAALANGRDHLAEESGQPIRLLAYPHGKADARVVAAAYEAGYTVAFAGGGRPVLGQSDSLNLPRWEPPRTAGAAFELAVARTIRG